MGLIMRKVFFLAITGFVLFSAVNVFGIVGEEEHIEVDRPGDSNEPTKVSFFVYVIDVDDIDGSKQNFAVNVFILLRWKDERLAQEGNSIRKIPIDEVWHPRILITNQQGFLRTSLAEVVKVLPDGAVTYWQR